MRDGLQGEDRGQGNTQQEVAGEEGRPRCACETSWTWGWVVWWAFSRVEESGMVQPPPAAAEQQRDGRAWDWHLHSSEEPRWGQAKAVPAAIPPAPCPCVVTIPVPLRPLYFVEGR